MLQIFLNKKPNLIIIASILSVAISASLIGCSDSGNKNTVNDTNNNLSTQLQIEKSAVIPVLDGKSTIAGIYVRNTSNTLISNISYSAIGQNELNQLDINKNDCTEIAANSSCLLHVTTPPLEQGASNSAMIIAEFNGQQSKQVINYRYFDTKNYTNEVNFSEQNISLFGTNDYVTTYTFVGQGQMQNNVTFKTSNSSLAIIGGLVNGKVSYASNQVIPLELQSNHIVTTNLATVQPITMTSSIHNKNNRKLNNNLLQVQITPTQQANLLMSNVSILSSDESSTIVTIVNNGNQLATDLRLIATSTDVAVETAEHNPCSSTLAIGASCKFRVNLVNSSTNGNALLELKYNNSVSEVTVNQNVYFMNNVSEPMVSLIPQQTAYTNSINQMSTVIFNVHNIGGSPLNNTVVSTSTTLKNTAVTILNNSCPSVLAAHATCQVEANVASSNLVDSGLFYIKILGNYTSVSAKNYSFVSLPVNAVITDPTVPTITSTTPQDTSINVALATPIIVNFSESMNPTTININSIHLLRESDLEPIPLIFAGVTNNNQTATLTIANNTLPNESQQYIVVVDPQEIQDANGTYLGNESSLIVSHFSTSYAGVFPVITSVQPINGTTNVSRSPSIDLSFSLNMEVNSFSANSLKLVTESGSEVSGITFSFSNENKSVVLNLNGQLLSENTTYKLIVNQTMVSDIDGNKLGSDSNYTISQFTVGDFTAPSLTSVSPINGSINIPTESSISLTYSEAMNTATLNIDNIKLKNITTGLFVSLNAPVYTNNDQTVIFKPSANLSSKESYQVIVNESAITDVAGFSSGNSEALIISEFTTAKESLKFEKLYSDSGLVACGITYDKDAYCWSNVTDLAPSGGRGLNYYAGILQDQSGNRLSVKNISLSSQGGCLLTTESNVYCWGPNNSGQAGQPYTGKMIMYPTLLQSGLVNGFDSLMEPDVGGYGTSYVCGLSQGKSYCWGSNQYGTLGNGTPTSNSVYYTPVATTMPTTPEGLTFTKLFPNAYNVYALGSDGKLYAWGLFADGSTLTYPVVQGMPTGVTSFIKVAGLGNRVMCALANNANLYCWGTNTEGEQGIGSGNNGYKLTTTTKAVTFPSGVTGFKDVFMGASDQTMCAIGSDDYLYCWGKNTKYELGLGTFDTTSKNIPTKVKLPTTTTKYYKVLNSGSAGSYALLTDGNIYFWGASNATSSYGVAGNGTYNSGNSYRTPVQVTKPTSVNSWTLLASSTNAACATGDDQLTYCWGEVSFLGTGYNIAPSGKYGIAQPTNPVTTFN